jgi:GMP synthase (glutamine-hydrolysing)
MRVVVLQHESIEGPGVWVETLLEHGASVDCVLVPARGVPDGAGRADLVISMGGSMSVNDPVPWIPAEIELIARRIRSGAPVLGVCLGSQLIAKAAGGVVEPGGMIEIGFHSVELTSAGVADEAMAALPPRFDVLQWHGEIFRDVPGAVTLARSSLYPMQAFRVARAYGLLFHLEATMHSVAAMSHAFPDDLRRGGLEPGALLDEARERLPEIQAHARRLLVALLRGSRPTGAIGDASS